MEQDKSPPRDDGPSTAITNVFVLMLENHSFDNIFAMSGIAGIDAATPLDCNTCMPLMGTPPKTYCVQDGAPWSMSTDPGHEFFDVLIQLCGVDKATAYKGKAYPPIDMSGFATSYATSKSEETGTPDEKRIGDIMACFHTPTQLPVIHQLAGEFALCDAWYSSMPGPTWPNRFFVHGASSSGMDRSPTSKEEIIWELADGFTYDKGSIYDRLKQTGHGWRFYQDKDNQFSDDYSGPEFGGWISQVASLKHVNLLHIHSLKRFHDDLHEMEEDRSPAYLKNRYTFIEPNFGRSFFSKQNGNPGPTYKGGSSQHPEDDPSGGEGLIKFVYEEIRNSPVWNTSLLIVVYDEHGGFYDHVGPGPAKPPGDDVPVNEKKLNSSGFDFTQYGVRVPAVIVSPLIKKGIVDHTLYDHTSVLATLERILGIGHLTDRDLNANDLRHLLTEKVPRGDCPKTLVSPAVIPKLQRASREAPESEDGPLHGGGNTFGFLHVLLKAALELAEEVERVEILEAFKAITTVGQARAFAKDMKERIDRMQAAALKSP